MSKNDDEDKELEYYFHRMGGVPWDSKTPRYYTTVDNNYEMILRYYEDYKKYKKHIKE